VIGGNLTVDGNLVYVNVTDLSIEDPIIQLQTGPNAAAPTSNSGKDVGTALNYYDTQARIAFMGWDVSNAEFGMASQATISSEVVTFSTYGNLRIGNIIGNGQALTGLNASNISSGTIAQARLANASLTVNGQTIALGATGTITANTTQTLTFGSYLTGTSFNGGTATTIAVDATTTNTANKVVARDTNGSFSANIITATLSGAATSATTAGTVTTAAQPNITSVGTLTSLAVTGNASAGNLSTGGALSVTGNISAANVTVSSYHIRSVQTAISAAGTVQGNATALTKEINVVSTVASGAGVRLPTAVAGMVISITNTSANSLLVYPATSGIINSLSANAAFTQASGATLQFIAPTTTQWYTVGATYS